MDLLELFKDSTNIIEVKADSNVFATGEQGELMYIVLDGIIAMMVGYDIVDIMEAGDILGEMALIDSKERSATAVAKTDCRLVPVDKEKFLSMVKEAPDFSIHLMTVLAERLRNMNKHHEKYQNVYVPN